MKLVNRTWKKLLILFVCIILVSLCLVVWIIPRSAFSPIIPANKIPFAVVKTETKQKEAEKTPVIVSKPVIPTFDKTAFSNTDPSSIWLVINKQHSLSPVSYVPADLITTVGATISNKARADFDLMNTAALAVGVNFTIVSSYRSYDNQSNIYNNYIATYGQASTDTFSARPGYSEHQTGLAIDFGSSTGAVCNLDDCFGSTVEGLWLSQHSYEYGFIMRYPSNKQQLTGYKSEPWHFRYIGRELAMDMKNASIFTLEEYFNINGGEIYL
jgi:D-alanyl-D-alanine carboxypeptidase